jgi:hypothetical protein
MGAQYVLRLQLEVRIMSDELTDKLGPYIAIINERDAMMDLQYRKAKAFDALVLELQGTHRTLFPPKVEIVKDGKGKAIRQAGSIQTRHVHTYEWRIWSDGVHDIEAVLLKMAD